MQTAYIGMGANIESRAGTPEETLAAAARKLEELGRVRGRSSLYSTEPVGYADQPRFVNAVVALETRLAPRKLLEGLLGIERAFGRDRTGGELGGVKNGPRTLDLDILLYGDLEVHEAGLEIPHPRLAERAFVLVPLSEIASNLVVPGREGKVQQLLSSLRGGPPEKNDEVIPIESDLWRALPCGDGERAAVRPDARDSDG